ncbi:MAG: HDOD domain-containing protein [bacterium]|nr:HDOD domain-containing protein [bacterium]
MESEIRNEIVQSIKRLPTLPIIFEKILDTIDDPRSSAAELQETIKNDQSITAKVLNMANSAYYGYTKQVSDLTRAVVILGFDMVKNIALSVSVFNLFPSGEEDTGFDREQFWLHSIATGYLGKIIAEECRFYEPDKAFISCLLHDIGKVVLDCYFEKKYVDTVKIKNLQKTSLREAEEKVFGCSHTDVGYWLGEKWNFPEELLESIKNHHNPEISAKRHSQLTHLTYLANIMCQEEEIGIGGTVLPVTFLPETLGILNLNNKKLKKIREEIQAIKEKLETMVIAMK